ncbi:ABC transporter permease subunit [Nakamurella sp. YIM 132087]|uniref:ABC transporter permease subunit n=1 Tax=Nakamurella alba TaxID=2665158 RepID=A0A7K1FS97_9ACTN|nr:amino acid ABC transporter permease [Nakamurella alba]MTD17015.1 ABC transporter permease subunit [Nakamurella alba]
MPHDLDMPAPARTAPARPEAAADSSDLAAVMAAASRPVVRRRRPGMWVLTAVVVVLTVFSVLSVARNPAMEWSVVGDYFFSSSVLEGLWLSVWVTVLVTVLSLLLGAVLAAMRLSQQPVLRALAWGYVWIFRSVPLLVQLLVWFNIGYLYPKLSFGIPWGPTFVEAPAREVMTAVLAALLGLTLHETAYATEIIRGGLLSVDAGQREAAHALSLSPLFTFTRIVLPQAMRAILPSAGSLLVGTLKATSMLSVIAVADLLYSVQIIYNRTFQIIPLLTVACIWYLIVTSVLSVGQWGIEKHFARGTSRSVPGGFIARYRGSRRRTLEVEA